MTDDLTARRQRTVTAPDLRDEAKAALTSVVEGMTGRPVRSGAVTVHRVDGAPFVDATVTLRLWPGEAARIRAYGAGRSETQTAQDAITEAKGDGMPLGMRRDETKEQR